MTPKKCSHQNWIRFLQILLALMIAISLVYIYKRCNYQNLSVFVNVRIFVFFPNLSRNLQHATSPVKTMAPVLLTKVWPCVHVQKTGVGGYVITAPLATAAHVLECQPCVMSVNKDTT